MQLLQYQEKLNLENIKIIEDKFKNKIVLSRNGKIKIVDENDEKYSSNIPFGSKNIVNDGDKVENNQLLLNGIHIHYQ